MKAALNNLSKQNPLMLAGGAALLVFVVYYLARKTITDVAKGAGGIVSGNNALTEGTDYEGAGVLGTLGAATNTVLGGVPSMIGEWLGGVFSPGSAGSMTYWRVIFPDGAAHAVASDTVAANGAFTYGGVRYILGTQGGVRVARRA
jgi:hypothetical protein